MITLPLADNQCGTCTACCTVQAVKELGKPYYCTCKHQNTSGCTIYENRPETCRQYECPWRVGLWRGKPKEYRPDNLGVLFDLAEDTDGKTYLEIYEVVPNGLERKLVEKAANFVLKELARLVHISGVRAFRHNSNIGLAFDPGEDYKNHPAKRAGRTFTTRDKFHLEFVEDKNLKPEVVEARNDRS